MRWARYWYLLLLFYVAAVLGSIYIRHDLAGKYEEAVVQSQEWSQKFRHYARLGRLMTGVDFFDSKQNANPAELPKAAAQIEELRKEFDTVFVEDKKSLSLHPTEMEAQMMLKDLELLKRGMDELLENTHKLVQQSPRDALSESLPEAEGSYRKVIKTFARLRSRISGVEEEAFSRQIRTVRLLEQAEYGIAALLVFLVVGVGFYGNRLETQASKDLEEKELLLAQVEEADGKYRALFENASEGMFQISLEGRFIIANPALAKMCGYESPAEFMEAVQNVETQFYADRQFWRGFLQDVSRNAAVSPWETEVRCRGGNVIWVEQDLHAVESAPGKIEYFEGTLKNITDQKWADLRRTLDYLLPRVVAESESVAEAHHGVLQTLCEILDLQMGVAWQVESKADQLSLSRVHEDAKQQPLEVSLELETKIPAGTGCFGKVIQEGEVQVLSPGISEAAPDAQYAFSKGMRIGVTMPVKENRRVGHLLNLFAAKTEQASPELLKLLSSVAVQLGHLYERKQNEEALRESEALKAAIFESSMDSMITFDEEGLITDFNPAAEMTFGFPREAAIGKPIGRIIASNSFREIVTRQSQPIASAAGEHPDLMLGRRVELTALRADFSEFPVEMSLSQISHNEKRFFTACIREISDRKRAERARSELAAVVEASSDAIIGLSPDGNILSWNQGAEIMFGYSAQEVLGRHIYVIVPADRLEESAKNLLNLRSGHHLANYESVRMRKGGKRIDVSLTESPILNSSGAVAGISLIARDITETKELQEQFLQAQKMEAVGTLAGGIAHDFNNILTAIIGYVDLTLRQIKETEPFFKHIVGIKSSAEFAASLTHQLLAFSRRQTLELTVFPVNDAVLRIQKLLHRLIGENINILTSLSDDAGRIRADQGQTEQVIMNLAVNARDAMPRGGVLTLETSNVSVEEDDLHTGLKRGDYVRLSVSDTGCGMTEEVREHLFEPFFTTKEKGKGTGLGLATCYGIVKQVGGQISVESAPGEGTTLHLYFPRVKEFEFTPKPALKNVGPLPRGTETVLLVEDEETVRMLSADVLRRLGYQVIEAADCLSARCIIEERKGAIDLLLSDVVLPNSSGKELADWAESRQKDLKVLLMSGHVEEAVFAHHGLKPEDAFLQKPFSPSALAQKVREVIDSKKLV